MKRREGARLLGRERDEEFDSEGFLLPLASAAKAFSFAAPSQARFSLSCSPSFPLVLFTGDGMRRARPARVVGVDVGALRESARRYPRICLCSSPRRGRRRRPGRKKKKEKKQRYHSSCPSRLTAFSPSLWSSPSPHLTGSDATLGMCSACFREHQKSNASSGPQAPPVVPQGAETAAAVAAVAAATSSQPEPEASATAAGAPVEAATAAAPEAEMAEAATTAKAENEASMPDTGGDNAAVAAAVPAPAPSAAAEEAAAAAAPATASDEPPARAPQPPGRCMCCRKKISIAARFSCRCGYEFCSSHRLAEDHECSFDWKGMGREALAKANPLVQASKVDRI